MKCVYPLPPGPEVIRVDAEFLDPRYPTWRKRMGLSPDEHPGVDLNLAGTSGDSDLGYPVVSILPGVVAHAQKHRVWGNVVLIRHFPYIARYYNLPELWTQYAHLHFICVRFGDVVQAGQVIGSIGKGGTSSMKAHLHFEVRKKQLAGDFWPGQNLSLIRSAYLDPMVFLRNNADYRERLLFESGKLFEGRNPGRPITAPRVVIDGEEVNIGI